MTDIEFSEEAGVAWIAFNRPDKLNSFTADMHVELRDALLKVQTSQSCRALVITGKGRAFCAGQDLQDLEGQELATVLDRDYSPLIKAIKNLPIPVIASVNGVAAGVGANAALACDIVLAANSAKFIQSFSQVGLVPDGGGTWTLPRLIGLPRATALCMTGEPVTAQTAQDWGMIWRCVDDAELTQETELLAQRLANQATVGLGFTKQLLHMSASNTLDTQLDMERDFQQAAGNTADYAEGVSAFLNKRKPKFTGK